MSVRCCDCRIWRVYIWTCVAAFVSCVVGVVALGSPSWTEGKFGGREYLETGLLLFCHHRTDQNTDHSVRCAPLLFGEQETWFEAVRLMSLLSWVLLLTVFVMSILLHFQDDRFLFSLPVVILALFAGLLGVAGALLYVVVWTTRTVIPEFKPRISWGFAMAIIWHVITLLLFILVCIAGREMWAIQFKPKRRQIY